MTTLNDFVVTNLQQAVLDEYINRMLGSVLRGEFSNAVTMTTDITLTDGDTPIQRLNCNGANRVVKVPPGANGNHPFFIINTTSSGEWALSVKSNDGSTILKALAPGELCLVIPDGNGLFENSMKQEAVSNIPNARLSLSSNTSITTSDVTAATSVYYTPLYGSSFSILLDDGNGRKVYRSSNKISASLSGLTANKNYDVFVYDNSGTLTLELLAWSTDAVRATALTNSVLGFLVKTGSITRRYVGTIRITGTTGQCEDSATKRYLWNLYNRRERLLSKIMSGTWSYTTTAWRQANADAANKVEFVVGLIEDVVKFNHSCDATGTVFIGIGFNQVATANSPSRSQNNNSLGVEMTLRSSFNSTPVLGYNYAAAMEYGGTGGNFDPTSIHGLQGALFA